MKLPPQRLFYDMMDAAQASGMPVQRINTVHDAIVRLIVALRKVEMVESPVIASEAVLALDHWKGGNNEES